LYIICIKIDDFLVRRVSICVCHLEITLKRNEIFGLFKRGKSYIGHKYRRLLQKNWKPTQLYMEQWAATEFYECRQKDRPNLHLRNTSTSKFTKLLVKHHSCRGTPIKWWWILLILEELLMWFPQEASAVPRGNLEASQCIMDVSPYDTDYAGRSLGSL
jgi:hypothetical protein